MRIKFPTPCNRDPRRRRAGQWIHDQRIAYKKGKLSKSQIMKLEQIPGWSWNPLARNWDIAYEKALTFIVKEGKYPSAADKDLQKKSIAQWIAFQRLMYKLGKLGERKIRMLKQLPEWQWGGSHDPESANKKKQQLLEMAHRKEPKPYFKTKLGIALSSYIYERITCTSKSHGCYDADFAKTIRKLAPFWFDRTSENKEKLLTMARAGDPKPHCKTELGAALFRYIKKNGNSYDSKFDREVREMAPHWFVDTVGENKKEIIEMARHKKPRPLWGSKLGNALAHYTNKEGSCYDPGFDKIVRKLAPQNWFK